MECTIITIGDELLIGQVIDTNSAFIAQQLNAIGIKIKQRIAIADAFDAIQTSIQTAWASSAIVITTGGLGPTKDDITKKALANMFGVGFKRDEQTFQHVKAFFESRKVPFLAVNEEQADVPANAEVLFNARGTAPGMWFEDNGHILITLPGVPYEMEYLIQTHVLEKLKTKFHLPPLQYAYIQTSGLGESFLAKKIANIEDGLPTGVNLAYLPSPMAVNLRLSGTMEHRETIQETAKAIASVLDDYVYGDSTTPIEQLVFQKLKEKNKQITLVESCTGGYIAHILTNISGSSEIFQGGWTVYTNAFKEKELGISTSTLLQYTAVSQECALELLEKALMKSKADFGIAVVGYLENYEQQKPHAFIAYGNITDMRIKKLDLFYPRIKSKEAIARVALVSLYKEFLK